MTLIVIDCSDFAVVMLRMHKRAAVLSALMKMFTIPFHGKSSL